MKNNSNCKDKLFYSFLFRMSVMVAYCFSKILLYKYINYIMLTVFSSLAIYSTLSIVFYKDISLGCHSSLT